MGTNKKLCCNDLLAPRYKLQPVMDSIYIAEGQNLKFGSVVDCKGFLCGSTHLEPYAILYEDCDTTNGAQEANVLIMGEFNIEKLVFGADANGDVLDKIVFYAKKNGIIIRPYDYALSFTPPEVSDIEKVIPEGASADNKLVTQSTLDEATAAWDAGYTPKGTASVSTLNSLTGQENGDRYILTDSGTLTNGSIHVVTGSEVAWDATNSKWYEINPYANIAVDAENRAIRGLDEGFDFSFTGTGVWSSITKEWRKPMKANSKIIFSKINIEIGTAGYPFRFTGHKADGTDFTVGLGNVAGGELAEDAVVTLVVPQDFEWLEFLFAAPSGSSNSIRVDFDTKTSNQFNLMTSEYLTGCLSAPYASSTRTKRRFIPSSEGVYKLTLSSSFASQVLSSANTLISIQVVDKSGNARTIYSQVNDGNAIPLTHYLYFGKDDDYIILDAGLDAGTDISISLETSEGLVYTPDFRNFVEANLADFGDASYPNFELRSIGNFDGRAVNLPAFPIYVEQGCYIFSKDSSQYVFGCVIDGDGVQHALGDSAVKSVAISTTGMLFIAIQYGASYEIEYMVNSIMIVCPSADVMARVVEENAKYRNLNVSHVKKYHTVKSVNHRGYNHEAPENTLPAFRLSAEHGFDSIETDLQVTSDGHYVLFHDDTIDNKSDGTGTIASHTLAELKALDFGSWFSPEFAGTKIATLEEMLECCYNLGIAVALELKVNLTWAQLKEVLSIIKKYRMEGNVSFCGFLYRNYIQLLLLERTATIALTQASLSDNTKARLLQAKSPYRDVMISLNWQAAYTEDDIQFFKDNGILIEWYAPSTEDSVLAVADSADSIISDTINATTFMREHELAQ